VNAKRILFVSGSLGLGHIVRDLQIAKALRKEDPEIGISWLADDAAAIALKEAGETLLLEAELLAHGNVKFDNSAEDYSANLVRWTVNMRKGWSGNAALVAKLMERGHFDLVVGDEAYDIIIEMVNNPSFKKFPFVMIYDFIGVDAVTHHPMDLLATYMTNRIWVKALATEPSLADRSIFIGEIEDVPDKKFGFMLPNRRRLAEKHVDFVGYVLSFNPKDYQNMAEVRQLLGYGKNPLIICSIGGTAAGKALLELCVKAYPIIRKEIPEVKMVLVCGPRLPADSIPAVEGVEVKGYVPELYKHLAAADLCIVTGGGMITLELTALQRPFLYFPLEQHFEQERDVALRCERHRAGIKMKYSETTPELLAEQALSNIGKRVDYASIPIDGAQKAAKLISNLL
jgi:UDP-N-acetylglucosamine:LPS N-acetylglucosamine transferase